MKKKIVVANRRYFKSYGPERYMLNIMSLLQSDGFEAIPFTVKRKQNIPSEYEQYFVKPMYDENTVFFNESRTGIMQKIRIFSNCVYSFEAKKQMESLIKNKNVDLVYLLGIANDISPSVISACKKAGIPVIMRLSDFNLICGNYHFLRENKLCDSCVKEGNIQCIKHKCVKNKFLPSFTRTFAMTIHNLIKIYDYVDAFICPCSFMKKSMIDAGYPEEKLYQINTFVDPDEYKPSYENDGYILYFSRLSHEKGVEYLLKAKKLIKSKMPIYLVGDSNDPVYFQSLKDYISSENLKDIHFIGFKAGDELKDYIRRSKFVVIPSICPDNSPITGLEAMACGKPIIGSDIGGITDQITEDTGYLVKPADPADLAKKIEILWNDDQKIIQMGKNARLRIEQHFSPSQHFEKLNNIFINCINKSDK